MISQPSIAHPSSYVYPPPTGLFTHHRRPLPNSLSNPHHVPCGSPFSPFFSPIVQVFYSGQQQRKEEEEKAGSMYEARRKIAKKYKEEQAVEAAERATEEHRIHLEAQVIELKVKIEFMNLYGVTRPPAHIHRPGSTTELTHNPLSEGTNSQLTDGTAALRDQLRGLSNDMDTAESLVKAVASVNAAAAVASASAVRTREEATTNFHDFSDDDTSVSEFAIHV